MILAVVRFLRLKNFGQPYQRSEENVLAKKYGDRVGEIISAEVYRFGRKRFYCWMKKAMN